MEGRLQRQKQHKEATFHILLSKFCLQPSPWLYPVLSPYLLSIYTLSLVPSHSHTFMSAKRHADMSVAALIELNESTHAA